MKTVSNYVPAVRTVPQNTTTANAPKTNQHEENSYKWMGQAESLHKRCSRIHSVRKFVLTAVADK